MNLSAVTSKRAEVGDKIVECLSQPAFVVNRRLKVIAYNGAFKRLLPNVAVGTQLHSNDQGRTSHSSGRYIYKCEEDVSSLFRTSKPQVRSVSSTFEADSEEQLLLQYFLWHQTPKSDHSTALILVSKAAQSEDENLQHDETKNELDSLHQHLSHDISGPIASVNALLKLIGDDLEEKSYDEVPVFLNECREQITRLRTMLKGLALLSHVGRHKTQLSVFDMRELVHEVALENHLCTNEVDVSFINTGLVDKLSSDRFRIKQILQMLFSNSIEHRASDRSLISISVQLTKHKGGHTLVVSDNGIGFPPDLSDNVFDMFVTGATSQGAGLGLYIVKKQIGKLGGSVAIASQQNPTQVTLMLPTL